MLILMISISMDSVDIKDTSSAVRNKSYGIFDNLQIRHQNRSPKNEFSLLTITPNMISYNDTILKVVWVGMGEKER